MKYSIEEIAELDGRYTIRAMYFVHKGMGRAIEKFSDMQSQGARHISGSELCHGLAEYAREKWGRMAKVVLNYNRIHTTRDFGEIVYALINYGWMSAQDQDSISDFDDIYDFEQMFEKQFSFED